MKVVKHDVWSRVIIDILEQEFLRKLLGFEFISE